jgi:PAS domain S-box-containing protein
MWESIAITVFVFGVASTLAAYLALRARSKLLLRLQTRLAEGKGLEAALRESEEKYRSLISNIPDVVWSLDSRGNIVFVSPRIEQLGGWTAAEVRQGGAALFFRTIHPDDVSTVKEAITTAYRDRQPHEVEYRAQTKDGRWIWVRARTTSALEKDGVLYLQGLLTDVTERKRAEAENTRLVTAIEQSPEAVVITDPQGAIQYVNSAFSRITGYSREEILGKNPRILKSGKQDPAMYMQLWTTILKGETWRGELVNRRKDGSLYTEQMTITPVRGAHGEVTHFISTMQDVTEHKLLEQQLYQAQRIEAVGRLAGGVAHDFNNLLTIISGYGQLLQERLDAKDLEYLEEILKAGGRATSLTRQLLAFSRLQILAPRVLDLNSVVAELEKMLRRLIGEDIELATVRQPGLGQIKADPGQIEQVIVNLAVNARDAMPKGGKLTIETADIYLDEAQARTHATVVPGPHVMVAVSDTGMGMDADTQKRIFEPFFTTKERGKGTGLGLATVYGIVKQSGGSIWVYSEVGQGSTFKIYFPRVVEGAPQDKQAGVRAEAPRGTETILVAEDEEGVRSLVCATLRSKGYQVLEAPGPLEALALAESHAAPIHLLLTDLIMPKMSGKELSERLSALHPETRLLFMSGYTDDAVVRHGIMEASTSFLQKPFAPNALAQKVREVLDMDPKGPK